MKALRSSAAWCCRQLARLFNWLGDLMDPAPTSE